jgi:hypothetical protein
MKKERGGREDCLCLSTNSLRKYMIYNGNDLFLIHKERNINFEIIVLYRARIFKRLWSPGIDSEESISPVYVAWRAGMTNRGVVLARQAGNRFLGSLKGLQIRAQCTGTIKYMHIVTSKRICTCYGST